MNKIKENNLYLRILKFWEAHPKGFTYEDINKAINPQPWENKIIKRYLYNAVLNNSPANKVTHETIFIEVKIDSSIPDKWKIHYIPETIEEKLSEEDIINKNIWKNEFILKYDAYFNYIDYKELTEALKSSREAKIIAIISIIIAIITWLFQISKDSWLLNFLCNLF